MKTTILHVYIRKPAHSLNSAVVLFEFSNLEIHHSVRHFSFLYLLGLNFPINICSQEDLGSSFTHSRAALHIKRTPSITRFLSFFGFPPNLPPPVCFETVCQFTAAGRLDTSPTAPSSPILPLWPPGTGFLLLSFTKPTMQWQSVPKWVCRTNFWSRVPWFWPGVA